MALTKKMTDDELAIHRVYTKPELVKVIKALFGLSNIDIASYFDEEDPKPHIREHLYLEYKAEKLDELPDLQLEHHNITAESKWILRSNLDIEKTGDEEVDKLNKAFAAGTLGGNESEIVEELYFYQENQNEYTQSIQDIVDTVIPEQPHRSLIPVTILIPSSKKQDGNFLAGKKTCWQHINLKGDNQHESYFAEIIEDDANSFGLRLLLIFKLLGMAELKYDAKNSAETYNDILMSTSLKSQVKLTDNTLIKDSRPHIESCYAQVTALGKLNKELTKLYEKKRKSVIGIDKLNYSSNTKNIKKITKLKDSLESIEHEVQHIKSKISHISNEKAKIEKEIEIILGKESTTSKMFYYRLTSKKELVFPRLTSSLRAHDFTTNKVEYVQREACQSKLNIGSMRLALSRLLPYTSGTAITFHFKHSALDQKINSPLLVLPKLWKEFLTSLKQYDYDKDKTTIKAKNEDSILSRTNAINYHTNDAKNPLEQPEKFARFFPRVHTSAIDHTVNREMKHVSEMVNDKYPVNKGDPVVIKSGKFIEPKK